jgi:hypothetical protein
LEMQTNKHRTFPLFFQKFSSFITLAIKNLFFSTAIKYFDATF